MTWFELLCQALGRDDLVFVEGRVPFDVAAAAAIEWHEPAIHRRGDHAWELTAGSPQGLEAVWRVREHPDTRAIECSGSVRNVGRADVKDIRELRTLDLSLGLTEPWGEPFVRTVNGALWAPAHFPPDDFRFSDRRLLRMMHVWTPSVAVRAESDGFPTARSLPCAILGSEAGDRGVALFYEWPGLWSMSFQQEAQESAGTTWPWAVRVNACAWGLALDLRPGEELPLPNLLLVGFEGDLDAGGNALRRHIVRHVAPKLGGEAPLPPTSFNAWFAFGNDINTDLLKQEAAISAEVGIEYFCIDAAWLRGGFRHGCGNWSDADPVKFPEGIPPVARHLADHGMKLGVWFEPEFAHVESELYRAHPEWFLHGPRISPWSRPGYEYYPDGVDMLPRHELGERFALIDFGQAEARQWWVDRLIEAYERWDVRWLRLDLNQPPRPFWDTSAAAGRVGINQINHAQGLAAVLDEVMAACPDLFLEQCASGGNRIELGMVRRGHSLWMNDQTTHTDVVRALQHGLNTVLPGIYPNTNLCQARFDYTDYDYLSHGGGPLGYSGRLGEAPRAERERFAQAIERFKGYRHLLNGDYVRSTGNPDDRFERAHVAWSEGGETVEMEFNASGPGSAELRLSGRGRDE